MPCYTVSQNEAILEGRNPNILKDALEDMGFQVTQNGDRLSFSGVNKTTGKYETGTYVNGVLTSSKTLNVTDVKKSYATQVAAHNVAKMKASGLKIGRLPDGRLVTYK